MPVTGMEAEFNVVMDGVEIDPREFWGDPTAFIDQPLLRRGRAARCSCPPAAPCTSTEGVIEVVTPVIELAPGCTARVVRNLWEQIHFVRDELTKWEAKSGKHIRLKAYSAHYNVSFELKRREQNSHRNIQKLALLLAHLLPIPLALVGTNRRSTGLGVRPRGNRLEVTADFTPDPGLMIATATLVVGIVRAVIEWPSYELSVLDEHPLPLIAGVVPGKHTTRKGWLTKDFQYPGQSPFTTDVDSRVWRMRDGTLMSLRAIARQITWYFRNSIRRHADPFSLRHLFAIMNGRAPSMLELPDRPPAYYDVGRLIRWGMVLPPLQSVARGPHARHDDGVAGRAVRRVPRRARQGARGLLGPVDAHRARAVATAARCPRERRRRRRRRMARRPWASSRPRRRRARPRRRRPRRQRPQPRRGDVAAPAPEPGQPAGREPRDGRGATPGPRARAPEARAAHAAGARAVPGPPPDPVRLRAGLPEAGVGRPAPHRPRDLHPGGDAGLGPGRLPPRLRRQGAPALHRPAPEEDQRLEG